MPDGPGPGVEKPSDFGTTVARWDAELKSAEKATERWRKDAARISKRYTLEDRRQESFGDTLSTEGDFNILHSNIQTMQPAVFGRAPVPVVMRRHRDKDPVGRIAAEILERALKAEIENDMIEDTFRRVTLDMLLVGRGQTWVRYEPEFAEEHLVGATAPVDYVLWSDFLHAPKTTWPEVMRDGWVARRVSMTRAQGVKRFGNIFKQVPLKEMGQGMELENDDMPDRVREVIGRASVWEIWDAVTKRTVWICRDYLDKVLDERDDPLGLEGFFPCPCPAYGTVGNGRLVPTPDYLQYEKLADELDEQTRRISHLTDALRVAGVYDASMEGLGQLLEYDNEDRNKLVPVTNYAKLLGQGLDAAIQFLPLEEVIRALIGLYDARDRTKQTLYEVSGLSDIMRGQVDPREKLGQSQLKGRFAGQRLQQKVEAIEMAARDTLRIKAEIMAEHYEPQHLRQLSGFDYMAEVERVREQQPGMEDQLFQAAHQLITTDRMRGFRLDIETKSTVMPDEQEEKERRVEFLEAAGQFMERGLPVAQQVPSMAPLMAEMMLFAVRGFSAGRQLEGAFEEALETARNAPPEQPAPEEEAQAQAEQAKGEAAQMQAQAKLQEAQAKIAAVRAKAEADGQKAQADMALIEAETEARVLELQAEIQKLQQESEIRQREAMLTAAMPSPAPQQNGGAQ